MKYLIIGNSVSGIWAVEGIREKDKNPSITIISGEKYQNYSRPLISYYLGGKLDRKDILYRDKDFYKGINLVLNDPAKKIIPKDRRVETKSGKSFHYDRLLIATGGTPIVPDIKGIKKDWIFNFYTMEDAENIKAYIRKNNIKNAVVLGGGLIGLKATEALLELGIKVTIVELADRILSATFDKDASSIIESALNKIGCKLILNNTITEIKSDGVLLKDKKKIQTNMLIIAIGVKPNIDIVKGTGIKINRGIVVDRFMRTNIENIYAAGDVSEAEDLLIGGTRTIAIWPIASIGGKIAGMNMAGADIEYKGSIPMNSVELCGIPTISIGLTDPKQDGYEIIKTMDRTNSIYKKIVIKDNRVVGAIFVGNIERAGIYTGLIRDKVDISTFKEHFLKDDFGFISLPESYRKHLVEGPGVEI